MGNEKVCCGVYRDFLLCAHRGSDGSGPGGRRRRAAQQSDEPIEGRMKLVRELVDHGYVLQRAGDSDRRTRLAQRRLRDACRRGGARRGRGRACRDSRR